MPAYDQNQWTDIDGQPVLNVLQDLYYGGAPTGPNVMQPLMTLASDDIAELKKPPVEEWFLPPKKPLQPLEPPWSTDVDLVNRWREIPAEWIVPERPGTGHLTFDQNGVTGDRIFACPFVFPDGKATYLDFCQKLLGWTFAKQNGTPIIIPPDVFSEELNWLLCQSLEVNGEDLIGTTLTQAECRRPSPVRGAGSIVTPLWPSIDVQIANGSIFPNLNSAARLFPRPNGVDWPWPKPITKRATYKTAIIKAKYAPFDHNESVSLSGQALSRPGNVFAYSSDTDPDINPTFPNLVDGVGPLPNVTFSRRLDDTVSVMFPMTEHSIERRQIWEPNFYELMSMVGKVNKYQFLTYPARTALLLGCEGKKRYFANGTRVWDLTFKIQFNPREHVKILRKDSPYDGQWWYVKDRNGNFIYDQTDLNKILNWS